MADRDGDDDPTSEPPADDSAGDSTDDEQQVPSSTAADAKDGGDSDVEATDEGVETDGESQAPDDADAVEDQPVETPARRNRRDRGDPGPARQGIDRSPDSGESGTARQGIDRSPGSGEDHRGSGGIDRSSASADGHSGAQSQRSESATAAPRPAERDYDDVELATAPDDQEMPLTEHVEEMALRFLAVGLVMFGVAAIVVFYADALINFLWYSFLGDPTVCPGPECDVSPRVYHPLSLVLARLKVSTLVGLIIALPVGVYQTYRFMRPGLYPRERRYYLAAVPTSLILAAVGIGFAYFAVLPSLFAYFTEYSEQAALTAFGLTETFNLIVLLLGFFALIFQIPLLVMLAIMMGITTRKWLEERRLYFWGGFAAVAFLFSPDPTGMAPLIVAVTMIVLFEGTLTLLRWTGTGSPIPTAAEAAAARPFAYLLAALGGYVASSGPIPSGYYGLLPPQATDALASVGGPIATPAVIAGGLIALFEIGAVLLRRFGTSRRALRARLAVDSARIPVWLAAVAIGYFGSPDPTLLRAAEGLALTPTGSVLVGLALAVLYELSVLGLRYREREDAGPTPDET